MEFNQIDCYLSVCFHNICILLIEYMYIIYVYLSYTLTFFLRARVYTSVSVSNMYDYWLGICLLKRNLKKKRLATAATYQQIQYRTNILLRWHTREPFGWRSSFPVRVWLSAVFGHDASNSNQQHEELIRALRLHLYFRLPSGWPAH